MNVTIISNNQQTAKTANEGAIHEQKMLGFPQDNGILKPYSNIFYWSHLKTDYGSVISEHPHIGFEIIIYVLKGKVEVLDNINGKRSKLNEGDMQVLKSGKGMKHLEKLNSNSEILQIWLDPNFEEFKKIEPSLCKSQSSKFPVSISPGRSIRTLTGGTTPIVLDSQDVSIQVMELSTMDHRFPLNDDRIMSGYILDGELELDSKLVKKGDFFIVRNTEEVAMNVLKDCRIFTVLSPDKPSYPTYADMYL
ncbi:MAG: pirin family protein [Bacteroidetes bacterium]|nr:pirin family protein [Bacteroidales bacterium]NJO69908.1 pirin family protein [Bacteroidota bacterium]